MKKQRVIVLRTAGTNCDIETCHAFKTVGGEVYLVHINELFSKRKYLAKYDILAIPGGFSYGDDIAAGRILGNELRYKLYKDIKAFASSGKPIIGICNGFQVLVKSGLLPGFDVIDETQQVTLGWNDVGKFECRWVYLKRVESRCIFTKNMPDIIYLPIAHAEGKFMVKDQLVLDRLKENQQVVFKYVDSKGIEAPYPFNPNGSVESIAGISNTQGNVFGMMPHPERFIVKYQHPRWTREKLKDEGDGLIIFRNAVEYAANRT
jgi:phosphoribosylformylglycinamidine synthase